MLNWILDPENKGTGRAEAKGHKFEIRQYGGKFALYIDGELAKGHRWPPRLPLHECLVNAEADASKHTEGEQRPDPTDSTSGTDSVKACDRPPQPGDDDPVNPEKPDITWGHLFGRKPVP